MEVQADETKYTISPATIAGTAKSMHKKALTGFSESQNLDTTIQRCSDILCHLCFWSSMTSSSDLTPFSMPVFVKVQQAKQF